MTDTNATGTVSAIDKAIAAAKARKAARDAAGITGDVAPAATKGAKAPKAEKAPKPDNSAEKAAKAAAKEVERAAAKAVRDAAREERKATKLAEKATKPTAHMSKVEKARAKLPALDETAAMLFADITANLQTSQMNALAQHIEYFNRANATVVSLGRKLTAGVAVRITGGDPRYIGCVGVVEKAQRIRCYVDIAEAKRPVYLFTSNVEVLETTTETETTDLSDEVN